MQLPVLQFVQPTNGAVFSTFDEIPIMLRAVASNDVFPTATVFANQSEIAEVSYCCSLCPCVAPFPGLETTLQIPVPRPTDQPPSRPWQGWTNVQAGTYSLTARATGLNGTVIAAAPVNITVLDLTLEIIVKPDGTVMLTIPRGSLVPGGFDLEASPELRRWTRLGAFAPGNVDSFYFDISPADQLRFYRFIYIAP
jgi:hypothetical protein